MLLPREEAEPKTVGEVMLSRPKTLPAHSTVADLRRVFENPTMRTVLLVDGARFVGTVERPDLPDSAAAEEPAQAYARLDAERVGPERLVRDVIPRLNETREGRLVVVDEDGETLRGMLCLRNTYDAFCTDGDLDTV
jgi:CBS domain-containing protein